MKNPILSDIQHDLKDLFTYFNDDNVLAISATKETLPFLFVITDNDELFVSVAVDYQDTFVLARIMAVLSFYGHFEVTDPFYIGKDGNTHMGDAAYERCDLDVIDLDDFDPVSDTYH